MREIRIEWLMLALILASTAVMTACSATTQTAEPCVQSETAEARAPPQIEPAEPAETRVCPLITVDKMVTGYYVVPERKTYMVKRRCNINEAVKAVKYDWVDSFIPERFSAPVDCKEGEEVTIHLFSFPKWAQKAGSSTPYVAGKQMQAQGYEPADWTVFLPLAEQYPEFLKEQLFGFGNEWPNPYSFVTVMHFFERSNGERGLAFHWVYPWDTWDGTSRFAAVRK